MRKLLALFLVLPALSFSQKKQITLEDIYVKGTFRSETVPVFQNIDIERMVSLGDVRDQTGMALGLKDYLLSPDKKKLLVFTSREYIYRRSSKAFTYLYDIGGKKTIPLDTSKLLHATFSPDGSRIA